MEEGKVKEVGEAQVLEEKVEVSGMAWLRCFLDGQAVHGGHHGHALGPGRFGKPPPRHPRPPPPPSPARREFHLDSPFCNAPRASQAFGAGEVGVGG